MYYYTKKSSISGASFALRQDKLTLPSVTVRTHGEVDPMTASVIAIDEEFIKIPLGAFRDIQQDRGITDGLLKALHMDIHRAARQVVARW